MKSSKINPNQNCNHLLDLKFKDFSRTFQELFEQIQGPFVRNKTYYVENFLVLYTNSAMSFTRFASWGKIQPLVLFWNTVILNVYVQYNERLCQFWWFSAVKGEQCCCNIERLCQFWWFSAVKGEQCCPFRDFQV